MTEPTPETAAEKIEVTPTGQAEVVEQVAPVLPEVTATYDGHADGFEVTVTMTHGDMKATHYERGDFHWRDSAGNPQRSYSPEDIKAVRDLAVDRCAAALAVLVTG